GLSDPLKRLSSLYLSGNPWRCDCNLCYLHSWIQGNSEKVKLSSQVSCKTPPHLAGQAVISLRENQLICPATLPPSVSFIPSLLLTSTSSQGMPSLLPPEDVPTAAQTTLSSVAFPIMALPTMPLPVATSMPTESFITAPSPTMLSKASITVSPSTTLLKISTTAPSLYKASNTTPSPSVLPKISITISSPTGLPKTSVISSLPSMLPKMSIVSPAVLPKTSITNPERALSTLAHTTSPIPTTTWAAITQQVPPALPALTERPASHVPPLQGHTSPQPASPSTAPGGHHHRDFSLRANPWHCCISFALGLAVLVLQVCAMLLEVKLTLLLYRAAHGHDHPVPPVRLLSVQVLDAAHPGRAAEAHRSGTVPQGRASQDPRGFRVPPRRRLEML
ncbi:platelet glycoprotein Ib alpha chain-like, partial [Meleagris gallopavo]|uniref:platelet glycoprotein Ib alpha chain-like n=1 Tax=Meleagris gallopavo TaxID=9103 RepID=UPI00093BBED3